MPTATPSTATPELTAVWNGAAEAALQTAFDAQNLLLTQANAWLDSATAFNRDALRRWIDLSRLTQTAVLTTLR